MMEIVACREDLAAELARWGRLQGLYVRRGLDLVEVSARRGRAARWGRPRFLRGDSALVRTLETRPGSLLSRCDHDDSFGQALLEELRAEAVVLARHRGRLLAAASLCSLDPMHSLVDADVRDVATRFAVRLSALEDSRFPGGMGRAGSHPNGGKPTGRG